MKTRLLFISLLIPALVLCTPNNADTQEEGNQNQNQNQEPQETDELAPEIKDGDNILATNSLVETFVTTVEYPERDYSYSAIKRGSNGIYENQVSPGTSDIPSVYTIRFERNPNATYTGTLSEGDWTYTNEIFTTSDGYWEVSNLLPNASYTYRVKNGDNVIKSGSGRPKMVRKGLNTARFTEAAGFNPIRLQKQAKGMPWEKESALNWICVVILPAEPRSTWITALWTAVPTPTPNIRSLRQALKRAIRRCFAMTRKKPVSA